MKLLTIIALAFSFIRPMNILAEDVVNTTDTAISPTAVVTDETEEEQNTILALLLEMYNRPEVQSSLSILAFFNENVFNK